MNYSMIDRESDLLLKHINSIDAGLCDRLVAWRDREALDQLAYDRYIDYRWVESDKVWYVTDKGKELLAKGGYERLVECNNYKAKSWKYCKLALAFSGIFLFIGIANKIWIFVVLAIAIFLSYVVWGLVNDEKFQF